MAQEQERQAAIQKLQELIRDIRVAMLTTVLPDGSLRSRPMETARAHFDGDLWFFTEADAPKVAELAQNPHVNLSYAQPDDDRYVSISGTGQIVRDRKRIEVLWNPLLKQWFPQGLDDPQLALLQVNVEQAEFWDAPSNAMVQLGGLVKSVLAGRPQHSPHEKIDWQQESQ